MDPDPDGQRQASLRASDADRERFVEALRQHHAEGRLTTEELSERTEQAYQARTLGDLDALATDLPPIRPPSSPGGSASGELPPRMRPPGPQRAEAKANMLRSVMWYAILSVFLVVVWALSGREYFWPAWPILGFMLLLAWQATGIWTRLGRFDDDRRRPPDR